MAPMKHSSGSSIYRGTSPPVYGYEEMPEIPRVKRISHQDFLKKYWHEQQPVVIEQAIGNWPAFEKWNPEYFRARWGNQLFQPTLNMPEGIAAGFTKWQDYVRPMPLAEFLDLMDKAPFPCYLRQVEQTRYPGIEDDYNIDDLDPRASSTETHTNVWIQSEWVNSTLHFDMQSNWKVMVYGQKRVVLYAPDQSKYLYGFPDTSRYSRIVPNAPDFKKYPLYKKARGVKTILNPGDALFIPNTWWHHLCSTTKAISLNSFYGPKCNISMLLKAVNAQGVSAWGAVLRDFLWLGMCGASRSRRGMAGSPTGEYIYDSLMAGIKSRLRRSSADK